MFQIWKDVRDFEGFYKVSNLGRAKSLFNNKERILSGHQDKRGYTYFILRKNGCNHYRLLHDMVFEAFYRRLQPNEVVHHLSQVKTQNFSTNLVAIDSKLHVSRHSKSRKASQQAKQKMSVARKKAWREKKYTINKDSTTGRFVEHLKKLV